MFLGYRRGNQNTSIVTLLVMLYRVRIVGWPYEEVSEVRGVVFFIIRFSVGRIVCIMIQYG